MLLTHRQVSTRSQEPYPKANVSQNSFSGWFQLWCSASHLVATCRAHGQLQQLRCESSLTMSLFPLAGADRRNYIWGKKKVIMIPWKSRESRWKDITLSVNYWENNICGGRRMHPPPGIGTKPWKVPLHPTDWSEFCCNSSAFIFTRVFLLGILQLIRHMA